MLTPFHIAFQVRDIAEAREFYGNKMGFSEGRSDTNWIDFNMFGHQVVVHLNPELGPDGKVPNYCNPVDDHAVPVPHFGVVLNVNDWKRYPNVPAHSSTSSSSSLTFGLKDNPASSTQCSLRTLAAMHWSSKLLPISNRSYSQLKN